ncbi:ribulose-5-phosphate 4-epimerase-like epimerase or aldolase [Oleiphilus messinensis]|uniref:Ribulose-5-phosphate 4-epimerase-like epimerase or aldolase n=1 Tax=Oleiphilus messinensis TaxID=141451 RepID=A0A1Y0IBL4_9GAMM|nr:class II aldolase/adducin family protein [Oleiphilus messinensis]ARU57650.1 ribulose-5-phosphate 4-epimerase-like epimerase or aldolase [Oleiphilus messinensis]
MEARNSEQEGVIKYDLEFRSTKITEPDFEPKLQVLNRWRSVLWRLGLVGQDPLRYGGLGFGNISIRIRGDAFLVSGSQTGHLSFLSTCDCAFVRDFDLARNSLIAEGECRPSSEALSHGALYDLHEGIGAVVHVHSPEIWQGFEQIGLRFTSETIPYGTPEMAFALQTEANALLKMSSSGVVVMRGHHDGVISFGRDLEDATMVLLSAHARAVKMKSRT